MQDNELWQEIRTEVWTLYSYHLDMRSIFSVNRSQTEIPIRAPVRLYTPNGQPFPLLSMVFSHSKQYSILWPTACLRWQAEFIPVTKEDFFVQSVIKRRRNLHVAEKCNTILSVSDAHLLPNDVHRRLSEVNNLRNWIVHGTCYHSTLLVVPSSEPHVLYEVVDEEPGKSWGRLEQKVPFVPVQSTRWRSTCQTRGKPSVLLSRYFIFFQRERALSGLIQCACRASPSVSFAETWSAIWMRSWE